MCLPQGPWAGDSCSRSSWAYRTHRGMCVYVREKANSSCLRSGRPVLPGAQVCPHWHTRSHICGLRKNTRRPSPTPADSPPAPSLCALLVPFVRQAQKPGPGQVCSRRAVTCWAMSAELLGPRRSSFSGEGNARKVETSAGGGEDSAEAGS